VAVVVLGLPGSSPAPANVAARFAEHRVGVMHTHTGYSDGAPRTTARDVHEAAKGRGLDFAAPAEHSEAFPLPNTVSEKCLPSAGGSLAECILADAIPDAADKWDAQRRHAVRATVPGEYLGMRGFELTDDVHGHMSVYFSRNYTVRSAGEGSLEAFYAWLRTPAHLGGGSDGLATFNHPNDKGTAGDPRRNWNDLAYVADLDDRIVGIEIFNRNRTRYEPWVVQALDNGWHLGMVGSEDHHGTSWGDPSLPRTVVISDDLTMPAMKEAMRQRRTYAIARPDIRIDLKVDGREQGAILRTPAPSAQLVATVTGADVAAVQVMTNNGEIVEEVEGTDVDVSVATTPDERWYMLRVLDGDGKPVAYSAPVWVSQGTPEPAEAFTPRWVAGDLHIHTTWSHDAWGGPADDTTDADEFYTLGWSPGDQIAIAESRGLDFVALTDHNNTLSVHDPGYTSDRLTLVPGYEASFAGHTQLVGVDRCFGRAGQTELIDRCNRGEIVSGRSAEDMRAVARHVRDAGGLFQINHPSDGKTPNGDNWKQRFGDGNGAPDGGDAIVPDSIEVWNVGAWHWQVPAPSSNDNDWSLAFWETYLNAGHRVAATGGSDNHWRSVTAVAGAGQPTTWVYVTEPGVAGIVAGIRAGRTTLSHQPPALGGPRLGLESADGTSLIGGDVQPGAQVIVRAEGAAPNAIVRVVTNLGPQEVPLPIEGALRVTVPEGAKWLRAELRRADAQDARRAGCDPLVGAGTTYCRNRLVVEALTSPVYVPAA